VYLLLRISELVYKKSNVTEMDINPLIIDGQGVLFVDAQMMVDYLLNVLKRFQQ
jgi:succinyl-CoA synthetase beta subunit